MATQKSHTPFLKLLLMGTISILGSTVSYTQNNTVTDSKHTTVKISLSGTKARINPMIYGQMLEDCNDNIIYGGIVDKYGNENKAVTEQLRPLSIPVMRWPGGSAIYDYEWKRGIGKTREAANEHIWKGMEYYTFGTDEFIRWCRNLNIEPYINLPMGNNTAYDHTLKEALEWIEYVNGEASTPYGSLRARNGHPEPYDVRFWCIGNENYLANPFHESESAAEYAAEVSVWGERIKNLYPDIHLLAVGHDNEWNSRVLEDCSKYIDYLTLHYYFNSMIDGVALVNSQTALFNAALVEASLKEYIETLEEYNNIDDRKDKPIRFSIDEWNNRHSVKHDDIFYSTRRDDRRLYDVCTTASMLNVFLRNSQYIAMANYIFPVNGHGLVKTTDDGNAYRTAIYYVFELYRRYLQGSAVPVSVSGPGHKNVQLSDYALLEGDVSDKAKSIKQDLCFVDSAASIDDNGIISISLVNRSYSNEQNIRLKLPEGYKVAKIWKLESQNVTDCNTAESPDAVKPYELKTTETTVHLLPCSLAIVRCKR